jgi:hypothetical protein
VLPRVTTHQNIHEHLVIVVFAYLKCVEPFERLHIINEKVKWKLML